jgi:hypothetical protein
MPFIVPFACFGHWCVPTLILAIFLLIFGGVKGIVEVIERPNSCQFETNFAKNHYGVVTFFVILPTQQ